MRRSTSSSSDSTSTGSSGSGATPPSSSRQSVPGFCSSTRKELHKRLDGVTGRPEVRLADPPIAMVHERRERLARHEEPGRILECKDGSDVRQEYQKILRRQALEPKHGTAQVDPPFGGEAVLGQPRLEGLVAVKAPAAVEQELGRSTEDEPETFHVALEHVVQDPQNLLVVLVPRLGALQLVEVDHLVEYHQQPSISGDADEAGKQLERVVDIGVVDYATHRKSLPGLGLRRILRPQPTQRRRLQAVVTGKGRRRGDFARRARSRWRRVTGPARAGRELCPGWRLIRRSSLRFVPACPFRSRSRARHTRLRG